MSERKYRQRGTRTTPPIGRSRGAPAHGARPAHEPGAPAGARRISQDGPRNINMPGYREVVRCAQCGYVVGAGDLGGYQVPAVRGRSADLRTVRLVRPGQPLRVHGPITARVSPKNARNTCTLFSPRTTVERETTTPKVDSSRKAFDDLFKF